MARATASGIAGLLAQQPQRPSARASRDQFGEIRAVDSDGTVTFEVRLDGAEGFAPCTCTCEVHHGDRVLCHIVNHRIVVFSNVTSPRTRMASEGPGKGCRPMSDWGMPSARPTRRTSSLKSIRRGSTILRFIFSGKPPTLWWLLILAAWPPMAADSMTSG